MTDPAQQSHSPFQEFFRTESAAGALLVACAAAALLTANSARADWYSALWQTNLTVAFGSHLLSLSLHQWINDGLMAIFFLLVGLEIKREILGGELASPRQALPTLAFEGTASLDPAKLGILGGSIAAAVVGTIILRIGVRVPR